MANAMCAMCASCPCPTPKCCAFPQADMQCARRYTMFEQTHCQPAGAWRVQVLSTGTSILLTACGGAAIQRMAWRKEGLVSHIASATVVLTHESVDDFRHRLPLKIAIANMSPSLVSLHYCRFWGNARNCSGLRNSACAVVSFYCATMRA